MDKKSLAILIVASSLASSTFATGIINKLITKHSSATSTIVNTHKTTKQTNHSYTDFSGTWIANCGDGSQRVSTVIKNDAYSFSMDGFEMRIGEGLSGQSESNEAHTSLDNTSIEWNEDGSALNIKSVNLFKSNSDNSPIETDISQSVLTMKNGQITLDGKWTMFEDVTQTAQPMAIHCVFVKKQ